MDIRQVALPIIRGFFGPAIFILAQFEFGPKYEGIIPDPLPIYFLKALCYRFP